MMQDVEIEGDGRRFWVRDGRNLQKAVPVILVGVVDPDEKNAGEHGDGINPSRRDSEGFFGPPDDVNPSGIAVEEVVLVTNAGGEVTADLIAAPGTGRILRLLSIRVLGTNLAGGVMAVDTAVACNLKLDEIAKGRSAAKVNVLANAKETAISAAITSGGSTKTYLVECTYRTEDYID